MTFTDLSGRYHDILLLFRLQWYAFTQFCSLTKPKHDFSDAVLEYAVDRGLKLPSRDPSEWCRDWLPVPYAYVVQASHWTTPNTSLLFNMSQLPSLVLAAPALYLILGQAVKFVRAHKFYCTRLGCTYFSMDPAQKVPAFDMYTTRVLPKECFVYVAHSAALSVGCLFCLLFSQQSFSATRILASVSPVLYWTAALLTTPRGRKPTPLKDLEKPEAVARLETRRNLDTWTRSILTDEPTSALAPDGRWVRPYFVGFAVVGTVMFANYLPWT